MTQRAFRRLYRLTVVALVVAFVLVFILLGDFVTGGGTPSLAFGIMLAPMILMAVLVFTRCASCCRSLGWISAHKNFNNQPNPETLDLCPHCGEPFFSESA